MFLPTVRKQRSNRKSKDDRCCVQRIYQVTSKAVQTKGLHYINHKWLFYKTVSGFVNNPVSGFAISLSNLVIKLNNLATRIISKTIAGDFFAKNGNPPHGFLFSRLFFFGSNFVANV